MGLESGFSPGDSKRIGKAVRIVEGLKPAPAPPVAQRVRQTIVNTPPVHWVQVQDTTTHLVTLPDANQIYCYKGKIVTGDLMPAFSSYGVAGLVPSGTDFVWVVLPNIPSWPGGIQPNSYPIPYNSGSGYNGANYPARRIADIAGVGVYAVFDAPLATTTNSGEVTANVLDQTNAGKDIATTDADGNPDRHIYVCLNTAIKGHIWSQRSILVNSLQGLYPGGGNANHEISSSTAPTMFSQNTNGDNTFIKRVSKIGAWITTIQSYTGNIFWSQLGIEQSNITSGGSDNTVLVIARGGTGQISTTGGTGNTQVNLAVTTQDSAGVETIYTGLWTTDLIGNVYSGGLLTTVGSGTALNAIIDTEWNTHAVALGGLTGAYP